MQNGAALGWRGAVGRVRGAFLSTAAAVHVAEARWREVAAQLDGVPLEPAPTIHLNPETGRHRMTVGVSLNERPEPLRVELKDVEGSAAQLALIKPQ